MRLTKTSFLNNVFSNSQDNIISRDQDEPTLLKRIGIWGFAFFAIKGILWIVVSFSMIWMGIDY